MTGFYVKIQYGIFDNKVFRQWRVQYFFGTDLRDDQTSDHYPIETIIAWCKG